MAATKPCFLCRKLMPPEISDGKNNCYEADLFSLLCRRLLKFHPEFFKFRSDLKISNTDFCRLCKQRIRNALSVWNQVRLLQSQLEAETKKIRDDIRRHYDPGRPGQTPPDEELAVDVVGRLFAQCWTDCTVLVSPLPTTHQHESDDDEGITEKLEASPDDDLLEVTFFDDNYFPNDAASNTEWSIPGTNNDHVASRSSSTERILETQASAEPAKVLNEVQQPVHPLPRKPRQRRRSDGKAKKKSSKDGRSARRVWGPEVVKCGDKKFKCRDCDKEFMYPHNVFVHFKRDHEKDFRFFCEKCGQGFVMLNALNTHVRVIHSEAKPFKCDLCDKSFKYKSHMKRHRRNHDDVRSYMCELCGSSFYDEQRLKFHKQRVHADKPTPCDLCGKMFASPLYAKYHRMRHKGNDPKFRRNRKKKSAATKDETVTEPTVPVPDDSVPCELTAGPLVSDTSST